MNLSEQPTCLRYLAVDLHKHYVVVGGVNARQQVVLPPRKMGMDAWQEWMPGNLQPTDAVVVEATTNAWHLYDQIEPLVGRVVVANPAQVKWIAYARVKTDRQDVLRLARLLAADLVPEVWVPPVAVRELRALLSHRRRLVKMRTMCSNRLQSVIHRHNLKPPEGRLFAPKHRAWWKGLELPAGERLRVRQDLATYDHLEQQVGEADEELRRLSTTEPWAEQLPYLVQLPGFGVIIGMTVLAAIGEITRFPTDKQLVGYAGLGASVHDSGETHRQGRITKTGRRDLRWALVEAAWIAAQTHPHWQREFERLARRMEKNKAIVAIARKLLVVVWHVLSERAADRKADPDRVAFKLMVWSWKLDDARRGGLTTRQFIRYHLIRLGLGNELTHIHRGGMKRLIAPPEELLALRPELRASG